MLDDNLGERKTALYKSAFEGVESVSTFPLSPLFSLFLDHLDVVAYAVAAKMTSFAEAAAHVIEAAYPAVRGSQYMTVIGCTVLVYDYCLNFAKEVELIWKAPLSTISFIYLINRYLTPFILALDIYDRLGLGDPNDTELSFVGTLIWVWVEGYLTVFIFMSMHALVAMRVYAIYGGPRWLKLVLWTGGVLYAIPTMLILGFGLYEGHNTIIIVPFYNVCFERLAPYLWMVWVPSLFYELLLFMLTMSKAIAEAQRREYSPITSILYRDGILYFMAIAMCSIFCMFVWLVGTMEMEGLAKYFATAIVNVAGSRLVLSLKTNARVLQMARSRAPTTIGQSSSFVIGSDTVANPGFLVDEYIMLEELSDTSQIGTVYPTKPMPYFEAI
ncbi:hypothetical protein SCHPADRAFT_937100 [Schizopora paradoxa]|uniref:DUF6533 domain-containing protein n=1 Tax=Schizopora paradoxa TaxID=27342 RepID=A0A0H2SK11_9AGAM|nr:hypothetical protein SCHPADRAFT_937100 [Schizopora paradoxa]